MEIRISGIERNSVTAAWDAVAGADAYGLFWADADSDTMKYEKVYEGAGTEYTLKVSTHIPYWFYVEAYRDGGMVGRSGKDYICPSFITSPSPCSFNPNDRELIRKLEDGVPDFDITGLCELLDVPYCEAQLHGDIENYGADAIESIFFSSEYEVCNLSVEALSAIGENMISLYVRDVPIKIEGGKIVKDEDRKEAE